MIINDNQDVDFESNYMPESLNCFMAENCVLKSELDFSKCTDLAVLSMKKAIVHFGPAESLDYFKVGTEERRGPDAKIAAKACSGHLIEDFTLVTK